MLALVFALLLQGLDGWIEQLGGTLEERDAAAGKILQMGSAAIPKIEKALAGLDGEKRDQLQAILLELKRRERVAPFRPSRRVSLALKDAGFADAVRAVFGVDGVPWASGLNDRRVTLDVRDATFWEAAEALFAASGTTLSLGTIVDAKAGKPEQNQGDLRLAVVTHGKSRTILELVVFAAPGALSFSSEAELEALDDQNRTVTRSRARPEEMVRTPGQLSTWTAFEAVLQPGAAVRIRGTITLRFPRDLERQTIEVANLTKATSLEFGSAILTVAPFSRGSFSGGGYGGNRIEQFLISAEGPDGRWLGDVARVRLLPETSAGFTGRIEKAPARLAIHRVLDWDEVKVPVDLPVGK